MILAKNTLALVRGTAAAVAITALAGCGGATTTAAPPPVVSPPRVAQVRAPVTSTQSSTNVSPATVTYDDYAAACGRG